MRWLTPMFSQETCLKNKPNQLFSSLEKCSSTVFPASHFPLAVGPGLEIPFFFFFPGINFSHSIFRLDQETEEMSKVWFSLGKSNAVCRPLRQINRAALTFPVPERMA